MKTGFRALGLALAAFGLFACVQEDKNPVQPGAGGNGTARLQLPALPAGYLEKSSVFPKAVPTALFALTISGKGMEPIRKTWKLNSSSQEPVTITGIPAGDIRLFAGRLIRIDSSGDTTVTHEGQESAWIFKDQVSEIRLSLRAGGTGGAHICVEVEGWPSDSNCFVPPDTLRTYVAGCYSLVVTKPGPKPGDDSIFKAKLTISQWDTSVSGIVTWSPGHRDSSVGEVFPSGTVYLGLYQGQFRLKAWVDSSGVLIGDFYDSSRGIWGAARAYPAACDSDTVVIDTIPAHTPMHACFAFKQIIDGGKTSPGRVGFETWGEGWAGVYTHWDGYPAAYTVTSYLTGSLDSDGTVGYGFAPPTGLFPKSLKVDSAAYTINLSGFGDGEGKVLRVNSPYKVLGRWEGISVACKESDFQL